MSHRGYEVAVVMLAQVGLAGQVTDVPHGGDVGPDGRLLSVAELQQAVRQVRGDSMRAEPTPEVLLPPSAVPRHRGAPMAVAWPSPLGPGWVAVAAAHSGAGASAVALGIADAAAAGDRPAHLVDMASPGRSGLAGTAGTEHGADPAQEWRRGRRGAVVVDRRAVTDPPAAWPPAVAGAAVTVIDLGSVAETGLSARVGPGTALVVVCRATVPGVRAVEQLLDRAGPVRVVCAVLGPPRWPGEVAASAGPALRRARESGLVVAVPLDQHLGLRGLTTRPLPKGVIDAGNALLALLDAGDGTASASSSAPRRRPGLSRKGRSA